MSKMSEVYEKYVEKNEQLKVLKKEVDELNKVIKNYMKDNNLTQDDRMYIEERVSSSLDEDKIIEIAKANCDKKVLKEIIFTKEHLDEEKFEQALYLHTVDAELFKDCTISKTVVALKYK